MGIGCFVRRMLPPVAGSVAVAAALRASCGLAVAPSPHVAAAVERLQIYHVLEFPQCVRELDRQLQSARAEVAFWTDRVANYRPLNRFGRYSASYGVEQRDRLLLLEAQQHLQRLEDESMLLWQRRQLHVAELMRAIVAAQQGAASPVD